MLCERGGAYGLWQEVHHQVEVGLIPLLPRLLEVVVKLDHARVVQPLHHLKLAVVVAPVEHHLRRGNRVRGGGGGERLE